MRLRPAGLAILLAAAVAVPATAFVTAASAAKPAPADSPTAAPKPSSSTPSSPKPSSSTPSSPKPSSPKPSSPTADLTGSPKPSAPGGSPTDSPTAAPKPSSPPTRPVKVVFAANGTIAAVDTTAGTIAVAAKAGTKDVKGTTVTIAVPSTTRILLNGTRKTLADLAVGYRITVVGTRTGTVHTAALIVATRKKAAPAPAPTPSPSDSATPGPSPSTSPSAGPSTP